MKDILHDLLNRATTGQLRILNIPDLLVGHCLNFKVMHEASGATTANRMFRQGQTPIVQQTDFYEFSTTCIKSEILSALLELGHIEAHDSETHTVKVFGIWVGFYRFYQSLPDKPRFAQQLLARHFESGLAILEDPRHPEDMFLEHWASYTTIEKQALLYRLVCQESGIASLAVRNSVAMIMENLATRANYFSIKTSWPVAGFAKWLADNHGGVFRLAPLPESAKAEWVTSVA